MSFEPAGEKKGKGISRRKPTRQKKGRSGLPRHSTSSHTKSRIWGESPDGGVKETRGFFERKRIRTGQEGTHHLEDLKGVLL